MDVFLGVLAELNTKTLYLIIREQYYVVDEKPPWNPVLLEVGLHNTKSPLPEHFMVLSGVRLFQSFVGFLQKLGYFTLTFSK